MSDEDLLNPPRFEAQLLKKQIISILTAWGMALEEADIASTVMIETDLRGVDSPVSYTHLTLPTIYSV